MTKRTGQTRTTIYRRHAGRCPIKDQPLNTANCKCPLWIHGKVRGKFIRQSLDTRIPSTAEMRQANIERGRDDDPTPGGGPQLIGQKAPGGDETLEYAAGEFIKAKSGLSSSSQTLYQRAVEHFSEWAEKRGIVALRGIDSSHIQQYFEDHAAWMPSTAQTRLVHLRVFFNYCARPSRGWVNFAPTAEPELNQRGKKSAAQAPQPRQPFSPAQITQIFAAVEQIPEADRDRARALVYLLLYTGMRISDATFAQRSSLMPDNTMDYRVIKTGKQIELPPELQTPAVDALAKLPAARTYFFQPDNADDYRDARHALYYGKGEFSLLMPGYENRIYRATKLVMKVLHLAGVEGTCHTFRDTFAINLLVGGADIYTVSKMLGHSDVRITDKHYMKLVKGYRERMSQSTRVLAYQFPAA